MNTQKQAKIRAFRKGLARVVEIGASDDLLSRGYDFAITGVIVLNLIVSVLLTFENVTARCGVLLDVLETLTVAFFAVDYVLRLIAARYIYPARTEARSLARYVTSFGGVVDLLSFLPYYLPFFFPAGVAAFRMFRVVRIFRLFRITAYYDSLNAIAEVITGKKQQLLSSVFIILVLMLGASLCMYSVEHEAQPEVFQNAFSGVWWAVSTLLTVGYGDIYPITMLGRFLGAVITFLGVGMVAIPTGIISAGFVEQYARVQSSVTTAREQHVDFIRFSLSNGDAWVGRRISELRLPRGVLVASVLREGEPLVPRGDVVLQAADVLTVGAERLRGSVPVELKEVSLLKKHPWNGRCVRDLDLSRQTLIVMVRRGDEVLIPNGDTRLRAGDVVFLHTRLTESEPVLIP